MEADRGEPNEAGGAEPPPPPGGLFAHLRQELELFRRHVVVLKAVMQFAPVGIIKLAEITNLQQHRVRYSLRVLEQEGLIQPSPQGAVATPAASGALPRFKQVLADLHRTMTELRTLLERETPPPGG